ncbi:MAG TPA: tRNA epoxyqueuosine(34) reductase QueG [Planctomycetota bacterium]|nr:tRNA epoxyqueuosine(34) reductase QueG [Planctomycetota bacterium]
MDRTEHALDLAREVGFDLAGVAPLAPPPAAEHFERWLEEGRHGSMEYLERNSERILDPKRILPEGSSILCVGLAHSRPTFALPDGARVARYAAGRDYHNVLGKLLEKLARRLAAEGFGGPWRKIVDAGPLLERSHAARAGLGFESRAANLLHPDFGPWFFLGELLIEEPLVPTEGPLPGSCGTCRACIDACPTGAIFEPGRVHAPDCISYQTIENRGPVPREMRERLGEWAFGCDVCSEVCPFGDGTPDLSERFGTHAALSDEGLVSWLTVGEDFSTRFRGSPLQRPRRAGLARNAALVLGNRPSEEGRRALLRALSFDPSPLVREASSWSLARAHGADREVRPALERARSLEVDAQVARAMDLDLAE